VQENSHIQMPISVCDKTFVSVVTMFMVTIPNRQINWRKKSNKKSGVLLKVVFLIIVPKNKFSFEKDIYIKMQFTGKLYHELFTNELSKRLQTRYPLNPLRDNIR
jgi:hypothetical protein